MNSTESNSSDIWKRALSVLHHNQTPNEFYKEFSKQVESQNFQIESSVDILTSGYPVEILSVIYKLKAYRSVKFTEVSRRLLMQWMYLDLCAQELVLHCIEEENNSTVLKTHNFHRMLFNIVDTFRLNVQDFIEFLLSQCFLAISSIAHGVRIKTEDDSSVIRTQAIALILNRSFTRFHNDDEYFHPEALNHEDNPWVRFCGKLSQFSKTDFIGRRVISKVLLSLHGVSVSKMAKTVFLVGNNSAAMNLFQPSAEFLTTNTLWTTAFKSNIPTRVRTHSTAFWERWATFVFCETPSEEKLSVWLTFSKSWMTMCSATYTESPAVISATFAFIALAKQLKIYFLDFPDSKPAFNSHLVDVVSHVSKCLDSTNEEKRICGMAVGQIMSQLFKTSDSETSDNSTLHFNPDNSLFDKFIQFFSVSCVDGDTEAVNTKMKDFVLENAKQRPLAILDSDDEEVDQQQGTKGDPDDVDEDYVPTSDEEEFFDSSCADGDYTRDSRLLTYISKGKNKLPRNFIGVFDVLMEGKNSQDEGEQEALREMSVLLIPVLIYVGSRIDANMAKGFVRFFLDMDCGRLLQIPSTFAILEISSLHPIDTFETMGQGVFEGEHYSFGQRISIINRYLDVIQLISNLKCLACFEDDVRKRQKDYLSLCPDFIKKYFDNKVKVRVCQQCKLKGKAIKSIDPEDKPNISNIPNTTQNSLVRANSDDSNKALTWREIVDRRVAAKTRYFFAPKSKTTIEIRDEYSSKLVPIIWASLANRIAVRTQRFMERTSDSTLNDMLLMNVLRVLGQIIMGTSGSSCPHISNIASQVGELVSVFIEHPDPQVRRSALSLLGICVTHGEGKSFVIDAILKGHLRLDRLEAIYTKENDEENRHLFKNILAFVTASSVIDLCPSVTA